MLKTQNYGRNQKELWILNFSQGRKTFSTLSIKISAAACVSHLHIIQVLICTAMKSPYTFLKTNENNCSDKPFKSILVQMHKVRFHL